MWFSLPVLLAATFHPASYADPVAELGRHLFFDRRLSVNNSRACGDCHKPEKGFSDGVALPEGATGETLTRNSMALVNLATAETFGWADNTLTSLALQIRRPLTNRHPTEMAADDDRVIERLLADDAFMARWSNVFDQPPNLETIAEGIIAFQLTLVSDASPFDRWLVEDIRPPEAVVRGFSLFTSDELRCDRCHRGRELRREGFVRTGVASMDEGLMLVTGDPNDRGRFKIPTLRNIAVTAPYMHAGQLRDLPAVIDHYSKGPVPDDPDLDGFILTTDERSDLIAFLESLTDQQFLDNPAFRAPATISSE